MGKVRPGVAPARCLIQAFAVLMPFAAADRAAADEHCGRPICPDDGEAINPDDPQIAAPTGDPSAPPPLPVEVRPIRTYFRAGYDPEAHIYESQWLDSLLFDPPGRQIQAISCNYPAISIPQDTGDDFGECENLKALEAPEGVAAIRWRLTYRDGLVETDVIDPEVFDLGPAPRDPQRTCNPSSTVGPDPNVVPPEACAFLTYAPLSPPAVGLDADAAIPEPVDTYTARVEWLDGQGNVVRSGAQDVAIPRQAPLIVSLGDSYASGQGNPDYPGKSEPANVLQMDCFDDATWMIWAENLPDMEREPVWFDGDHHLSLRSAPALAAQELQGEWPYLAFMTLARSGARIVDDEPESFDLMEQIERLKEMMQGHPERPIDVLLVSIGGNDVGFGDLLKELTDGDLGTSGARQAFDDKMAVLTAESSPEDETPTGYALVDRALDTLGEQGIEVGTILITEYPTAFFNDADNQPQQGCGVFEGFADLGNPGDALTVTQDEAEVIYGMAEDLNVAVHDAAQRYGWGLVDGISERFEGHGYCSGAENRFFVRAQDSCDMQGDFDGTMHPNPSGTEAMADEIAGVLRQILRQSGGQLGGDLAPIDP